MTGPADLSGFEDPVVVVDEDLILELREALRDWFLLATSTDETGRPLLHTLGPPEAVMDYHAAKQRLADLTYRLYGIAPTTTEAQ